MFRRFGCAIKKEQQSKLDVPCAGKLSSTKHGAARNVKTSRAVLFVHSLSKASMFGARLVAMVVTSPT